MLPENAYYTIKKQFTFVCEIGLGGRGVTDEKGGPGKGGYKDPLTLPPPLWTRLCAPIVKTKHHIRNSKDFAKELRKLVTAPEEELRSYYGPCSSASWCVCPCLCLCVCLCVFA